MAVRLWRPSLLAMGRAEPPEPAVTAGARLDFAATRRAAFRLILTSNERLSLGLGVMDAASVRAERMRTAGAAHSLERCPALGACERNNLSAGAFGIPIVGNHLPENVDCN
ncbi:hypothetical protein [Rhizobium dioscoreae]|uniref:hypothetical protein n=1 Tax=Rhizobium dioscoreae TaxID=2653122 RepID=UPI00126044D4|nr:hypothetical protein [Rhizobium dioscoreae]